jgi:hypothetical protein
MVSSVCDALLSVHAMSLFLYLNLLLWVSMVFRKTILIWMWNNIVVLLVIGSLLEIVHFRVIHIDYQMCGFYFKSVNSWFISVLDSGPAENFIFKYWCICEFFSLMFCIILWYFFSSVGYHMMIYWLINETKYSTMVNTVNNHFILNFPVMKNVRSSLVIYWYSYLNIASQSKKKKSAIMSHSS